MILPPPPPPLHPYPTPGDHDLSKHESSLPKDASTQVIPFDTDWFFRIRFCLKIFRNCLTYSELKNTC